LTGTETIPSMAAPLGSLFFGSDTLLLQCVEAWLERGHRVAAVATDTDKVRRWCDERGVRHVDAAGDAGAVVAALGGEPVDLVFAITWLRLLPDAVVRLARSRAINFHDGPLPRYAGLNATCWAILHGEREHGVTWHELAAGADTGAILLQRTFAIEPDDTAFTLNARCFQAGLESFGELADALAAGTVQTRPQDLAQRSYFGRHARPDALAVLDFARPAADVARTVRALDHGGYKNPLAVAKVRTPGGVLVPGGVELPANGGGGTARAAAAPGTVLAVGAESITVACADGPVMLTRLRCQRGSPLGADALARQGIAAGQRLPLLAADTAHALGALGRDAAPAEAAWLRALLDAEPLPVPDGGPGTGVAHPHELPLHLPAAGAIEQAAWAAAFLARVTARAAFTVGLRDGAASARVAAFADLAAEAPAVAIEAEARQPVGEVVAALRERLQQAAARGPLLRELVVRRADVLPAATVLEPPVRLALAAPPVPLPAGGLELAFGTDGARLRHDAAALPADAARALAARFQVFVRAALAAPATPLAQVPILAPDELRRLLHEWNDTAAPPAGEPCVHRQFAAAAARSPQRDALRAGGGVRTYAQLAADVERLAGHLRARGVVRGSRVGICTQRGIGMVAAVLATLRCGAAYVPLDPGYPRDRLELMANDAQLVALVVDRASAAAAPAAASCARVDLDADAAAIAAAAPLAGDDTTGDDLAYVIYTSGSTGTPKGVMVRHRNVTNFFTGMDRVLGTEPGTWLAVTSLSFDISVLELLWTTCRGFTVVVHAHADAQGAPAAPGAAAAAAPSRPVTFSLFYFASDEGERAQDKYRLLLDGARFADQHGFEAVWTPERHFHAFGGLYPNPAVASAAVAAVTTNVAIRAGSCVVTLHHPIRVAEDWALVDNLSKGRVGIAFAAGWHSRDFVLRPENFADRKNHLVTSMRQVQALWRGETVEFPGPDGKPIPIRTLPRPVQATLPSWVTIAGNPETYRIAGEQGCFVLTHLLGQSLEELTKKLTIYRDAWRAAGHPGEGRVTLMLHTFVGDDDATVRATVRGPMKEYLRSSLDLVKQAAWSFPAFKQRVAKPGEMEALLNGGLTAEDFEALLDFSFERYYGQSGLFGGVDDCVRIVDRLRGMQVDEIACLIDFGVPTDEVAAMLPKLNEVKRRCDAATATALAAGAASCAAGPVATAAPATIPELLRAHAVTHFQCTPSMAGMLLVDPAAAPALRGLQHMLVGGEALSGKLARELRDLVPAVHDVYGPTETTVWSTTMRVGTDEPVPIGRPLCNQRVYVLDPHLQPVPAGSAGELWIGGAGVTAGYLHRPELTAERFLADPFVPGGTIYGTGDLARWRADGVLEYLGRKDHQVKVRGYRIELGEIEAALGRHAGVRENVVVARTDGGDVRLVAYLVARAAAPGADELRAHLRATLPEFMVPSHFVVLADLPRTPNLKVDRKALPAPESVATGRREVAAASDDTESAILAIWRTALGTDDVGVEDNFFDSGGHSILAVRVHREIVQKLGVPLQVTDLFRFTTVRSLARHLQAGKSAPTAAQQAAERAKQRRNLLRRG
jgi:natural product biosynthesis luciferase-like monooxygenase protein